MWRTCLREVTFLDEGAEPLVDREAVTGADAYALLLEILCGLRSPMLGETEVMGQFRTFMAAPPAANPTLHQVGQRVLADAGEIREAHLRHLGIKSYGTVVRRRVRGCDRIAIIGTGQLAGQIVPLLLKTRSTVDQWGRRDAVNAAAGVHYRPLPAAADAAIRGRAAVVVAAPVASEVVERVCRAYPQLDRVIDLRGEADRPVAAVPVRVDALAEIFAEIESGQAAAVRQCEAARADIARRARIFASSQHVRPFGWEDLCA